ncbi:TetR/AcrR family transcriptional regulator [bacterium]|nr:TetR/AcrR family transcriptional regulator [bacterium]
MNHIENSKLKQLNATAMELFLKFGFKRVSVEEICRTAGVSKMTFYKYFKNKTDLLKQMLNQIADNQMKQYNNIMSSDISYSEKVKEIIRMKQLTAEMMGQELFNDLYNNAPPEISEYLHNIGIRLLSTVRNDFIQAQKEGHIRSDIHPDFILYFMNHMIDLASDENLIKLYDSPKALINEMIRFFFYGILTEKDTMSS